MHVRTVRATRLWWSGDMEAARDTFEAVLADRRADRDNGGELDAMQIAGQSVCLCIACRRVACGAICYRGVPYLPRDRDTARIATA